MQVRSTGEQDTVHPFQNAVHIRNLKGTFLIAQGDWNAAALADHLNKFGKDITVRTFFPLVLSCFGVIAMIGRFICNSSV